MSTYLITGRNGRPRVYIGLVLALALVAGLFSATAPASDAADPADPDPAPEPEPAPAPAGEKTEVLLNVGSTGYNLNSQEKEMDVAPFIDQGRTFVPVRFKAEKFGLQATWGPDDGPTEWVHLEKEGLRLEMTIGDRDILIIEGVEEAGSAVPAGLRPRGPDVDPTPAAGSRRTVTADAAPQIKDGRTVLPLRPLGELLGADFDWGPRDGATQWVKFTVKEEPVPTYAITCLAFDAEDVPLEGATVELNGQTVITDQDGRALFPTVYAGEYVVTVSLPGYRTHVEGIRVRDDLIILAPMEES